NYKFNTEKKIELHEEDGRVDFKNLNIVQNVVAGQILATKSPADEGEPGRTVTNEILPAKSGKDVPLNPGKNTILTEDGMSIVAEKNGQVAITAGKVVVEEVLTIQGDVNMKVGNITFLGTVIVIGNVEDGFSISAQGNIEIRGSVGKCNLDAEGDIVVSQGIMGKGEGTIRSGKNLFAKFIENVKSIDVTETVIVQDGIMHSYIDATKEISCVGKRATIVGGRLRAGELVKSKTIGSTAGTETIIEVGIDPKKRQRMHELNEDAEKAYKELEAIEANFHNLENQKRQLRKNFPEEKQKLFDELKEEITKHNEVIENVNKEKEEINKYLAMLKNKGKIIASKTCFPQVKLYIKNAFLQIRTEYKKVEFVLEHEEINVEQYTESEDDRK
ncbi:MAG: FapA family protein, partial [Spirochaetes bacterium]|nr:FapA family protein [Spirochaetota bacterium]